jgi:hypothetical protein
VFGLQENRNITCAQEAKFQASKLEKTLLELFLQVSLDAFFPWFCEARLAFPLERNVDFLSSKHQFEKSFLRNLFLCFSFENLLFQTGPYGFDWFPGQPLI